MSKGKTGLGQVRGFLILMVTLLGVAAPVIAGEAITITYYDYPPIMAIVDGHPSGPRIDQMTAIAKAAGMEVRWVKMSPKQEADMLDAGQRKFCATGRSYSPERAKQWIFLPYYLDTLSAHVVIARAADAAKIRSFGTIEALLADRTLTGVLLKNYIYGPSVDPLLAKDPPWIQREANSVGQVLDMVRIGRAHYTIAPIKFWQAYREAHDGTPGLVSIDTFGAMTRNPLYIPCSRVLEPETIAALSAAMASLGYRPVDFHALRGAP